MGKQYKSGEVKCRPFTDGSKVCISKKAWSVFFATINKMGADDTKPRPHRINETVFQETVKEVLRDMIEWIVTREGNLAVSPLEGGEKG